MAHDGMTTRRRGVRRTGRARVAGMASLEFVIILPIMLILTFGVMEFGWMLTKSGEIVNAAREGARAGAREGAGGAEMQAAVNARMSASGLGGSGYSTTVSPGVNPGDPVTVQITVAYDGNLELIGFPLVPVPANLRAEATFSKEGP